MSPTVTATAAPPTACPADRLIAPPPSSAAPPSMEPLRAVTDKPPVVPRLAAPSVTLPLFEVNVSPPLTNWLADTVPALRVKLVPSLTKL